MGEFLARLFGRKAKAVGHVHIYAPQPSVKSLTSAKCPDCGDDTVFVGFHVEWHGWDETCIRCGRRFCDDEWMPLDFYRHARRDSIKRALERWDRSSGAELIRRIITKADNA